MNPSSSGNGGAPPALVNGGQPPAAAETPESLLITGAVAEPNGTAVRPLPQERDHRLRGLQRNPAAGELPPPPPRPDHPRHRRRPLLVKLAVLLAMAALAVVLLQALVVRPFTVSGDAMVPTLRGGDHILVLREGLLTGSIGRGEIVVFHPPRSLPCTVVGGAGGDLVRRVVAGPGQVIQSRGQTILVDGRPQRERGWYDRRFGEVGSTAIPRTTLGPDRYFVLGDNRSDACDSRAFGPISGASVVGRGVLIVGRAGHLSLGTL